MIASLAILQLPSTFNDLLVALLIARDAQPPTVAIFSCMREFGSSIELVAPAALCSLPLPPWVSIVLRRSFAQGLLAGSVQ